jgi:hypothetical protein
MKWMPFFWVLEFLGFGFWEIFRISQSPYFSRANFPEPFTNFPDLKKAFVSLQAQNTTQHNTTPEP